MSHLYKSIYFQGLKYHLTEPDLYPYPPKLCKAPNLCFLPPSSCSHTHAPSELSRNKLNCASPITHHESSVVCSSASPPRPSRETSHTPLALPSSLSSSSPQVTKCCSLSPLHSHSSRPLKKMPWNSSFYSVIYQCLCDYSNSDCTE